MQDFIDKFFNYIHKDSLASDRFLKLSPEEQEKLVAQAKEKLVNDVDKLTNQIKEKDIKLALNGTFHPSNKYYRILFTMVTGIDLPEGANDTREAIANYIGQDRIDAFNAEKEAEIKRKQEEKARKEAERIENIKKRIKENVEISGLELVEVAQSLNIKIHPRTVHTLRENVVSVKKDNARVRGNSGKRLWTLYNNVLNAV